MNFCGWSDMRSLQFPIFLNLKCYKRRHFHLSELWLNWKKVFYLSSSNEESDLLTWFKFSGQEYWLNMSDKFELWLEGHAEDRSWCAELNGWLLGGACGSWMDELLKFQSASRLENVSGQDMHSDNFHPKSFNDRISILVEKDTIHHMDSFVLTLIFGAEIW